MEMSSQQTGQLQRLNQHHAAEAREQLLSVVVVRCHGRCEEEEAGCELRAVLHHKSLTMEDLDVALERCWMLIAIIQTTA